MSSARIMRAAALLTRASRPSCGVVAGLDIAVGGGDRVHAGAAAALDIAQVVAHVDRLVAAALQLPAVAVQRLRVRLAIVHVVRATRLLHFPGAGTAVARYASRVIAEPEPSAAGNMPSPAAAVRRRARFVGGDAPATCRGPPAPSSSKAVCRGRVWRRMLPSTSLYSSSRRRRLLSNIGLLLDRCPAPVFTSARAPLDTEARMRTGSPSRPGAVLGAQGLHHHHEFVGGIDQCAVQVEEDGPQFAGKRVSPGSRRFYRPAPCS